MVVQCLEGGDDIREPDPTWRSEPVHPPELGEDWWFGLLHQTREWLLGPNGEVLLQAVRAAFGPAGDADHDTLDTQCQRLAKRCWERIPASLHRELRDAILEIPDECWHVHELVRAYPTLVAGAALAARELFAHDRDE